MQDSSRQLLNYFSQVIYDKKGANIFCLDLSNTSSFFKYILIAEGTVDRHVKALAKHIIEAAEKKGLSPYLIDGERNGDWIVMDFSDIAIHLFIPEVREKYALEELWNEGEIIDLEININHA